MNRFSVSNAFFNRITKAVAPITDPSTGEVFHPKTEQEAAQIEKQIRMRSEEPERAPSPSHDTEKELYQHWADQEQKRLQEGKTPEEYYASEYQAFMAEHPGETFPTLTQEQINEIKGNEEVEIPVEEEQEVEHLTTENPWGSQLTPEQRSKVIKWEQDPRFMQDPESGQLFYDETPYTPEEVSETQQGWVQEENLDQEARELVTKNKIQLPPNEGEGRKLYPSRVVDYALDAWTEKVFPTLKLPKNKQKGYLQEAKNSAINFVNNQLQKMGASEDFQSFAAEDLSDRFDTIERIDELQNLTQHHKLGKLLKALNTKQKRFAFRKTSQIERSQEPEERENAIVQTFSQVRKTIEGNGLSRKEAFNLLTRLVDFYQNTTSIDA